MISSSPSLQLNTQQRALLTQQEQQYEKKHVIHHTNVVASSKTSSRTTAQQQHKVMRKEQQEHENSNGGEDFDIPLSKPRSFMMPRRSKSNDCTLSAMRKFRRLSLSSSSSEHNPPRCQHRKRPVRNRHGSNGTTITTSGSGSSQDNVNRPPRRNVSSTSTATNSTFTTTASTVASSPTAVTNANNNDNNKRNNMYHDATITQTGGGITMELMEQFNQQQSLSQSQHDARVDHRRSATQFRKHISVIANDGSMDTDGPCSSTDSSNIGLKQPHGSADKDGHDQLSKSSSHHNPITSWLEQRHQHQHQQTHQQIQETKEMLQTNVENWSDKILYFSELCQARYELSNLKGACVTMKTIKGLQKEYIHSRKVQHALLQLEDALEDGSISPKHISKIIPELLLLPSSASSDQDATSVVHSQPVDDDDDDDAAMLNEIEALQSAKTLVPTVDFVGEGSSLLDFVAASTKPQRFSRKSSASSIWSCHSGSSSSMSSSGHLSRMFGSKNRLSSGGTASSFCSTSSSNNTKNVGTKNASWGAATNTSSSTNGNNRTSAPPRSKNHSLPPRLASSSLATNKAAAIAAAKQLRSCSAVSSQPSRTGGQPPRTLTRSIDRHATGLVKKQGSLRRLFSLASSSSSSDDDTAQ